MAGADWVQVMKISDWVQCKKCGHHPKGQPAMACSGCKKVHGEWSPNPYGLYITLCQRRYMWQQALARYQGAEKQLVANQEAHKMNLDRLRPQALKVSSEKNAALAKQRELALKAAVPGPNTKARANAEIGRNLDEVEELAAKAAALNEKKRQAAARLEMLQNEVRNLEDTVHGSEIEVRALRSEGDRLKESLITATSAPAPAAAPPAAAPAAMAPPAGYVMMQQPQPQPQPQPRLVYQQQPAATPMYVQQQAAPQPAPIIIQQAQPQAPQYVFAQPPAPAPVMYAAAPPAPSGQWVYAMS